MQPGFWVPRASPLASSLGPDTSKCSVRQMVSPKESQEPIWEALCFPNMGSSMEPSLLKSISLARSFTENFSGKNTSGKGRFFCFQGTRERATGQALPGTVASSGSGAGLIVCSVTFLSTPKVYPAGSVWVVG